MSTEHPVAFTKGDPETVIAARTPEELRALAEALDAPASERKAALAHVAARFPTMLAAWAALADIAEDPVESYAYARVGYHRGLDALRASGWRGSGAVRAAHPENRGFLDALNALRRAAEAIGEDEEALRCERFLYQLDPTWRDHLRH
jgi:Protein of unknown function (DUF3151)